MDRLLLLAAALALLALPGLALAGLQLWQLRCDARARRQRLHRAAGRTAGPTQG